MCNIFWQEQMTRLRKEPLYGSIQCTRVNFSLCYDVFFLPSDIMVLFLS